MLLPNIYRRTVQRTFPGATRCVSTLPTNRHIYVFSSPNSHILSLLPTDPPTPQLSLGKTSEIPPSPNSFTENPEFLSILNSVLAEYAASDPQVQNQAAAFATTSASLFRAGSKFNTQQYKKRSLLGSASSRDEEEKAGHHDERIKRGGWLHISDSRAPPDYGRIAWPEDIFGSLEVDGNGEFVEGGDGEMQGRFQPSGTYRIMTREGILGLSDFLRAKLLQRLSELERAKNGH
ncbi:hypothetical protein K3495_g13159 [Podosphaera aphanis]|nr:hypothetical protein K3495_g13159 [Podosphaera aphanis]